MTFIANTCDPTSALVNSVSVFAALINKSEFAKEPELGELVLKDENVEILDETCRLIDSQYKNVTVLSKEYHEKFPSTRLFYVNNLKSLSEIISNLFADTLHFIETKAQRLVYPYEKMYLFVKFGFLNFETLSYKNRSQLFKIHKCFLKLSVQEVSLSDDKKRFFDFLCELCLSFENTAVIEKFQVPLIDKSTEHLRKYHENVQKDSTHILYMYEGVGEEYINRYCEKLVDSYNILCDICGDDSSFVTKEKKSAIGHLLTRIHLRLDTDCERLLKYVKDPENNPLKSFSRYYASIQLYLAIYTPPDELMISLQMVPTSFEELAAEISKKSPKISLQAPFRDLSRNDQILHLYLHKICWDYKIPRYTLEWGDFNKEIREVVAHVRKEIKLEAGWGVEGLEEVEHDCGGDSDTCYERQCEHYDGADLFDEMMEAKKVKEARCSAMMGEFESLTVTSSSEREMEDEFELMTTTPAPTPPPAPPVNDLDDFEHI